MTTGMIIMSTGAVIMGTALLLTIITAVTAPARKKKIEQKMKETYR